MLIYTQGNNTFTFNLVNSLNFQSQELMCQMAEKLIKSKCTHERDKTAWIEEKDKYLKTMERMRVRLGDEYTLSTPGSGNGKGRYFSWINYLVW